MDYNRPFTFDRVVRIIFSIVIITGILFTISTLRNVLGPFVIAVFVAYFLNPVVEFIQNKIRIRNRAVAVLITFSLVISILAIILSYLIPAFITEMNKMIILTRNYITSTDYAELIPLEIQNAVRDYIRDINLISYLNLENISDVAQKAIPGFWNLFSGSMQVLIGIVSVLIIFLYTVFILLDYKKLNESWPTVLPVRFRPLAVEVVSDLSDAMNLYFRSQGLIALIVGVLLAIGFKIIGLPMGIMMGLFIGALNIIPYLQILGIIPAMLLALLKAMETNQSFWHVMMLVLIVMAVVQVIQETVLTPRILGKAYGMNPAVVLLTLSVWGSVMGLLGMLLALPLTTLIYSYYNRFILKTPSVEKIIDESRNEELTD